MPQAMRLEPGAVQPARAKKPHSVSNELHIHGEPKKANTNPSERGVFLDERPLKKMLVIPILQSSCYRKKSRLLQSAFIKLIRATPPHHHPHPPHTMAQSRIGTKIQAAAAAAAAKRRSVAASPIMLRLGGRENRSEDDDDDDPVLAVCSQADSCLRRYGSLNEKGGRDMCKGIRLFLVKRGMVIAMEGFHTTKYLALAGGKVYIFSRLSSKLKIEEAMKSIRKDIVEKKGKGEVEWIPCDLGDLISVKSAARDFLTRETKLHLLINNAGIMCPPASGPEKQTRNMDEQWATNYLSHFLLTSLLLPLMTATASSRDASEATVRIINVSSDAASKLAPKTGILFKELDENGCTEVGKWKMYGMSKLALVLHSRELARRCGGSGIVAASLHPGTVKT
ncbi:hypothetical protein G7Y89_g14342 [Cudoniella acicularis]|uniref:Uncharacterized protein n=1 Tax=Cudoniella acicularis TaxID=354080 RepID=A0A8H4R5B3_9HELO|nr:hypothetical protein G7Y89_g14342 [Cudoniella acicularis]